MPHKCPRREAEAVAGVAKAPAEIDIIARGPELRIEAADCLKGRAGDDEIAARQMLGLLVVEHDMARCSRCGTDDGFLPAPRLGGKVGPAGCGVFPFLEKR